MATNTVLSPVALPKLSSAGSPIYINNALIIVAGVISLLNESQLEIQCQAVRTLNSIVDYFWPEVADVSSKLYTIFADRPR